MSDARPSFAVVIPMYNEEVGAVRCIEQVCAVLREMSGGHKLVVVNDGSRDKTHQIVEAQRGSNPELIYLQHQVNKGYGGALRTGIEYSVQNSFDYVLFMDSDLTNDPKDIPKFFEKMCEGYDVIKATRYSDGGRMEGVPPHRRIISRVGNFIARVLFRVPLYDVTNGFRAAKSSVLRSFVLQENNFSIIMEELYHEKSLRCSFARVPVILTNRDDDVRPTSFQYRPQIFIDYLKYPLRSFAETFLRA